MKLTFRKFGIVVVGALAGALMLPSTAMAQSRANTLEFILPIIYSPSSSFNGQGGSKADLAADLSAGFGIMYNLNNHLQLGGMFTWNTRSYNATIVSTDGTARKASGTLESSTLAFNATYYFMPSGGHAVRVVRDRKHLHRHQHSHRLGLDRVLVGPLL